AASLLRCPSCGTDGARTRRANHVEHDLTHEQARPVRTRFELAVRRMIETWCQSGRVSVSPTDVKLACEYLEHEGCRVEDARGARLRVVNREGQSEELSREATVVAALRRLAEHE